MKTKLSKICKRIQKVFTTRNLNVETSDIQVLQLSLFLLSVLM